jgi:transcriptional regulator with XRE-family HTH domain
MPPVTYQRERRRLGGWLRRLREQAGLSGYALAERAGWGQPKVSKIERGRQLPTEADIRTWTSLTGESTALGDLLDLLERARVEYATFREQYEVAGGASALHADMAALEAQATVLGSFQPAMVPSLVQTAEYAREMLNLPCGPAMWGADEQEIGRLVAARMARQQVLYQPGKTVRVVMLEAALRTRVVSPRSLAGQVDRLIAVVGSPSLELGVVPFDAAVPVYPLSGFATYDDDLVTVETITGEQQLSERGEVAAYLGFLDALLDASARGRDLVSLLQRVIAELR